MGDDTDYPNEHGWNPNPQKFGGKDSKASRAEEAPKIQSGSFNDLRWEEEALTGERPQVRHSMTAICEHVE